MRLLDDKNTIKKIFHNKIYIQEHYIMYHKSKKYNPKKEQSKYLLFFVMKLRIYKRLFELEQSN